MGDFDGMFLKTTLTPPCYHCKKRHIGCHAKCEDYRKFQEENTKLVARQRGGKYK